MINASPTGSAHSKEVFTCNSEQLLAFHAEELSLTESEALTGGAASESLILGYLNEVLNKGQVYVGRRRQVNLIYTPRGWRREVYIKD